MYFYRTLVLQFTRSQTSNSMSSQLVILKTFYCCVEFSQRFTEFFSLCASVHSPSFLCETHLFLTQSYTEAHRGSLSFFLCNSVFSLCFSVKLSFVAQSSTEVSQRFTEFFSLCNSVFSLCFSVKQSFVAQSFTEAHRGSLRFILCVTPCFLCVSL
jgi:hypothetical protein